MAKLTVDLAAVYAVPSRYLVIKVIRHFLRVRAGRRVSVRGNRGTAWGWINISFNPNTQMEPHDAEALSALLGEQVQLSGVSVPASADYYREYMDRARGITPSVYGKPYWD